MYSGKQKGASAYKVRGSLPVQDVILAVQRLRAEDPAITTREMRERIGVTRIEVRIALHYLEGRAPMPEAPDKIDCPKCGSSVGILRGVVFEHDGAAGSVCEIGRVSGAQHSVHAASGGLPTLGGRR